MKKYFAVISALSLLAFSSCGSIGDAAVSPTDFSDSLNNATAVEGITVFYDSDSGDDLDFESSWVIDDEKTIEAVRTWIGNFEETHESADTPLGLEIDFDRYKFELDGREILLNHYLETAVVIDDNYYTYSYNEDIDELKTLLNATSEMPAYSSDNSAAADGIAVLYDGNSDDELDIYAKSNTFADPEFETGWVIDDEKTIEAVRTWIKDFQQNNEPADSPLGSEIECDRYKFELDGSKILLNHYLETAVVIDDKYYTSVGYEDIAELKGLLSKYPETITAKQGNMKNMKVWAITDPEKVAYIIDEICKAENTYPKKGAAWVGGTPLSISFRYNNTPYQVQIITDDKETNLSVGRNMNSRTSKEANGYSVERGMIQGLYDAIVDTQSNF